MDADPSAILIVEPNLEMAEALSKDRVAPMIRASPRLRARVGDAKSRDSGNTIRHKEFPGGHLTFVGANSASGLAMRPIRVVIFDEIDRYGPSAGTEGDPVKLAETRTSAYETLGVAVKLYVSSPGEKQTSRLLKLWERSDKQEWMLDCPDCGHEQMLKWAQVTWDKDEEGNHLPHTAAYACEQCGSLWGDLQRWNASRNGRYVAQAPRARLAGFRVSGLAVLGRRLEKIVEQWIEAQGDPEQLKVFVTTVLCEWWEEVGQAPNEEKLMERREAFPERETGRVLVNGQPERELMVPRRVAVLTASTDVQLDRLEVQVEGWGRGEENWKLEYHVLYGDPTALPIWQALWDLMQRPRHLERGGVDWIRSTAVDTGYADQSVYAFVSPRPIYQTEDGRNAFTWAVKGVSGTGQVWPTKPSFAAKTRDRLYPIKVDSAKDIIYGRAQAVADGKLEPGPGYIHFPLNSAAFDENYFRQFTAEHSILRTDKRGYPQRVWEFKKGRRRNEAFDTAVYNYAALCGLYSMGFDLDAESDRVALKGGAPPPAAPMPAALGRAASSFVGGSSQADQAASEQHGGPKVARSRFMGG